MAELTDAEYAKVKTLLDAYDNAQQIDDLDYTDDIENKSIEVCDSKTGASEYIGLKTAVQLAVASDTPANGFARDNGDADAIPATTDVVGSKSTLQAIAKHFHLGLVKDGVLIYELVPGRVDLATDGTAVAIDGSMGDLMLYADCAIEFLKAQATVDNAVQNFMGLSLSKFNWNGYTSKTIDKFAITPDKTVHCKLSDDLRSQAHSIYNTAYNGSYTAPSTAAFTTYFRTSGAGLATRYVSGIASIQQAQNKNTVATTNRPYMGGYYEYFEILYTLMALEMNGINENDEDTFGSGITPTTTPSATTFHDEAISGNSGAKFIADDGTATYVNIHGTNIGGAGISVSDAFFGNGDGRYGCTEMLEPQRILSDLCKAGLQSYVGKYTNIFYRDTDGNMCVSRDGSIDPATGDGMETGKQYFVIRGVSGLEGIGDGVMTAVINCYVKMECQAEVTIGTKAIVKYSMPVYRGWTLPRTGCFIQMQGAHNLYGALADGTKFNKFICASDVDNIPAITDFSSAAYYGSVGNTLATAKGLDLSLDTPVSNGFVTKANYSLSLFCDTAVGGAIKTYERRYAWKGSCYGVGKDNQPEAGMQSMNASVLGCHVNPAYASARTVSGHHALSYSCDFYAGAFAVPHLELNASNAAA